MNNNDSGGQILTMYFKKPFGYQSLREKNLGIELKK